MRPRAKLASERDDAKNPSVELANELTYAHNTFCPQFLARAEDPCRTLTHFFDAVTLFGDCDYSSREESKKKNRSLLKLTRRSVSLTRDTEAPTTLDYDTARVINAEAARIAAYIVDGRDSFVSLVGTLARISDARFLDDIDALGAHMMLDRSITQHRCLRRLRMIDTSMCIAIGRAQVLTVVYCRAFEHGQTEESAAKIMQTIDQFAHTILGSRFPSHAGFHKIKHGLPATWRLHEQTHTPLSEREQEEQLQRVMREFPLLVVGLLHVMNLHEHKLRLIHDLIG